MSYLYGITDAARLSSVPASTIRRWLAEAGSAASGERKPYVVDLTEVNALVELLQRQ